MSGLVESFDIFDTVLTRRVGAPTAVFHIVGETLRNEGTVKVAPREFVRLRLAAERTSRAKSASKEVSLREISAELGKALALPATLEPRLAECELEIEKRLICPIPGVHARLAAARSRSPRLLFVSDMYLPSDFLRERLVEHGCWLEGDGLYVSAEHGHSKHSGQLFRVILEQERLTAPQFRHTGNHLHADFAAPRALGIAATHDGAANLNRYEEGLERHSAATRGLASVHAGSSRLARLASRAESTSRAAIRDVTAGVAGPVLTSYVSWVLRTARRDDVGCLYFVARDGFLLLELARQLAPRIYPDVELRYLYGSRQAWHLPGIFSFGEAELDWLFCPTDFLSVTQVCARVGLVPEEISDALDRESFSSAHRNRNLSTSERVRLRTALQCPTVSDLVLRRAAAARENLLAYLKQEGLLRGHASALVDLGWHGRAQDSLAKVIVSAGAKPPRGYYFGLNSTSGLTGLGERQAWFFDRRTGVNEANTFPGIEPLLETMCTANYGVTTGYIAAAGRIEPTLRPPSLALEAWGWSTVAATLRAYGEAISAGAHIDANEDAVRAMCHDALRLFWENPTNDEAVAWGAFPYEDDQTGTSVLPLANELPWGQAAEILFHGRTGPHRAAWWGGSRQLTPPMRRALLSWAYALRRFARNVKGRAT